MPQAYKNAYNCKKCPGNNGPEGCPVWVEYSETNLNGDVRLTKECGHQAMPKFMVQMIAASNRPAAAVESMRNEVVKMHQGILGGLSGVGKILDRKIDQINYNSVDKRLEND